MRTIEINTAIRSFTDPDRGEAATVAGIHSRETVHHYHDENILQNYRMNCPTSL